MLKKIVLFFICVLSVAVIIGCGGKDETKDNKGNAAAIVNDEVISLEEFQTQLDSTLAMYEQQGLDVTEQGDEFKKMLEEHIINSLINDILLTQASKGYTVTETEVNDYLESIRADFETEEKFNEVLASNSLTVELLKVRIEEQLKIDKYFAEHLDEVVVTEEEIRELFTEYDEMTDEELNYDELKGMIEQTVVQQKQEEQREVLMEKLRETATIEILI